MTRRADLRVRRALEVGGWALVVIAQGLAGDPAVEEVTHDWSPDLGLVWRAGGPSLEVERVKPGSLAAQGGCQAGDRLLSIEGWRFSTPQEVSALAVVREPGEPLELAVQRGGTTLTLRVAAPPLYPPTCPFVGATATSTVDGRVTFQGRPFTGVLFARRDLKGQRLEHEFRGGRLFLYREYRPLAPNRLWKAIEWTRTEAPFTFSQTNWHPNGRMASRGVGHDPTVDEVDVRYFYDFQGQQVATLAYQHGRPFEGQHVTYHPRGNLKAELECRQGMTVKATTWHANGEKASAVSYARGLPATQIFFDEAGKKVGTLEYRNGQPYEGISFRFDPGGHPPLKRTFHEGILVPDP